MTCSPESDHGSGDSSMGVQDNLPQFQQRFPFCMRQGESFDFGSPGFEKATVAVTKHRHNLLYGFYRVNICIYIWIYIYGYIYGLYICLYMYIYSI